ncbi:MAG: hypothetical protein GY803_04905 [Chloroflexi bacterium]|nr:hypothetical protein [Chloroflexota bacterium]
MNQPHSNSNQNPCTYPHDWNLNSLEARAGALVNEALVKQPPSVKRAHWEDMKQTAVVAFLEHPDKVASYAYAAARSALKNYYWVHIRGLNGGWKSLAARNYTVSDAPLEIAGDEFDAPRDNLHWRLPKERGWDPVPRPVEWIVLTRLTGAGSTTTETIFRQILNILAGMSKSNWYPEQIYRAALIIAMLLNGYTWEDVETRAALAYSEVDDIWQHYRKTRLAPFLKLSPVHREIIKIRGRMRIAYFEELSVHWLNQAARKMIVFPHGIYTVAYKRRGRRKGQAVGQMEASLQKSRFVNGRSVMRAVSLGRVGGITKEQLWAASRRLEQKLASLSAVPVNLGHMSAARQALFAEESRV